MSLNPEVTNLALRSIGPEHRTANQTAQNINQKTGAASPQDSCERSKAKEQEKAKNLIKSHSTTLLMVKLNKSQSKDEI